MEIRFIIDDKTIERLQERGSVTKGSDVCRDAIFLWDMATAGVMNGAQPALVDASGHVFPLVTPLINEMRHERDV